MTEVEAHEFIARWNCFLIPRKTRTEAEAIRVMDQYCRIVFILGPLLLGIFIVCFFSLQPRFLIIDFILLLILGLADVFVLWSHSRLKEVRRVLGYSQIVNRKS
jgi:hypothetical protein